MLVVDGSEPRANLVLDGAKVKRDGLLSHGVHVLSRHLLCLDLIRPMMKYKPNKIKNAKKMEAEQERGSTRR